MLWIRGGTGRLIAITIVVGISFYAFVPVIADARHRAPFFVLAAFLQYEALVAIVRFMVSKKIGNPSLKKEATLGTDN